MGKMSREKGARGERELAKKLSNLFNVKAFRGRQYKGSEDSPDVSAFDGIHIESKRVERLNIYQAMEQAEEDAGSKVPMVAHRKNRKEWLVIVKLEDLPKLCEELMKYERKS